MANSNEYMNNYMPRQSGRTFVNAQVEKFIRMLCPVHHRYDPCPDCIKEDRIADHKADQL